VLILPVPFAPFHPPKPAAGGPATVFPQSRKQKLVPLAMSGGDIYISLQPYRHNLIRTTHPEFKDLAQTWGWKMISVDEKMYP
jgi:hypothetical protein